MKKIYILGSMNMDLVINAPSLPKKGETITGKDFMMNPGGKGANQAVAIALSGGNAFMIGAVGNSFGKELKATLATYQVNTQWVSSLTNVSSGIAVIVLCEGDNRIILDAGANHCIEEAWVNQALSFAQPGDYLLAQLEIPLPLIQSAFSQAKALGMTTFLNVAPAQPISKTIFQLTDYFFSNQRETEFYTGIFPESPDTAASAARELLNKGVRNVLITMGSEGSLFYNTHECVGMKIYPVEVVDTTAAGDTFIGAFITSLAEGKNTTEAMDFASAASALCITKRGAQQSIPTRQQTEAFQRRGVCKRK